MRALIILFLFCTSTFSLYSQERLTSIVNEVVEEFIYTQEVDGNNYVLKTNPNDELKIFRLNDDFSLDLLHTNIFKNVHRNLFLQVIGENVYFTDGVSPIKYNFISNKEIRYTLPEGWFAQIWQNAGTRLELVSTTNAANDEHKTFILTDTGVVIDHEEDNFIRYVVGDFIVKSSYTISGKTSLFVENIDTGQRDTLILNTTEFIYYTSENSGQDLIYINKEGRFCKFEGDTGNRYHIPNVIFNRDEYDSFRWLGDKLMLLKRDIDQITVYNVATGDQTHVFDYGDFIASISDLTAIRMVKDKLLIQGSNKSLILDLNNSEIREYQIYFYPLLDERYFVATDLEIIDGEFINEYYLVDLEDYSEQELDFNGDINATYYAKVIPVGNEHLGVFWGLSGSLSENAFRIDIDSLKIVHDSNIQPKTNGGLPGNTTTLYKLGDNITFVSEDNFNGITDNIYAVEDGKVNEIVSDTIYDFYPSGFIKLKDKITYVTEKVDQWKIFSFDGTDLVQEATFPIPSTFMGTAGLLEDYVITDDNVFAIIQGLGFDSEVNLMRYDKSNGTVEEISEVDDAIFGIPLATDGENTYLFSDLTLFHVDNQGVQEPILSSTDGGSLSGVFRQSGDNIYFFSLDGVFLLDDKEAIQVYDKRIDFSLLHLHLTNDDNYTGNPLLLDISGDVENSLLYVDGSTVREVNIGAISGGIIQQENNYFFILAGPNADGERSFSLYNGTSDQLFDLTYLNEEERVINIHELNNTAYILTYERFAEVLNIYRMSDDFADAEVVFSSPVNSFSVDPNFKIFEREGMLYTNDFIFQVDQDYQFYELDVVGNASTPEMEFDDGFIYFIAKDETLGNQLFRIQLVGLRLDVGDIQSVEIFEVHPNPTNNSLNIPTDLEGEYTIFNETGQVMLQGEITNAQMDISQLPVGLHSLQIVSDKKIYVSRFVKINP